MNTTTIGIKDLYAKIVAPQTGVTSTTALLESDKTLKEQQEHISTLGGMSSLLDLLSSPWAMVVKDMIPLAPLVVAVLEQFKHELSLAECVAFVAQAAYLESWQEELKQKPDWWGKVKEDRPSEKFDRKLQDLGEMQIGAADAVNILHELPSSELMARFNAILSARLQELGLEEVDTRSIVARVAWRTDPYFHRILAANVGRLDIVTEFYQSGGMKINKYYASLDRYLTTAIAPLPDERVFDEEDPQLTLRDIYVPLDVQPLARDGKPQQEAPMAIETWATDRLLDAQSDRILFIQGDAGRGKSAFCKVFADYTRRKLPFTPILIQLQKLRSIEDNFTQTLETFLGTPEFVYDGWLRNKNHRFLFILDGFDELRLAGRTADLLKDFLGQIASFQERSHHRCLITSRPLALEILDRSTFESDRLDRVELMKMNNDRHQAWLDKWEAKFGQWERQDFETFLQACPPDISDRENPQQIDTNLVGEPLMLYLLGRMHREGKIQAIDLANTKGLQAKVKIYDRAVDWLLNRHRDNFDEYSIESERLSEVRRFMAEVALCVVQSGHEVVTVSSIESRLPTESSHIIKKVFEELSQTQQDGKSKIVNTLFSTFCLQSGSRNCQGSIEFSHKSFGEFIFAERLKEAIADWSSFTINRKGTEDQIKQEDLEWQIYDLLGYGCLSREIVDYLWVMLENSEDWQPLRLFDRLNKFWESWCNGIFIDKDPSANLPQKKMRLSREQMPDRSVNIGIRQVDIYTGLNVLILLLKLNYYVRNSNELNDLITFYPSGEPTGNGYTDRLIKAIDYAESIALKMFNNHLRFYLSGADFSSANLSGANLSGIDFSGANFSDADLSDANLHNANLSGANLNGANLNGANLSDTNITGANLAIVKWDESTNWQEVQGIETALNISPDLKQHLKFCQPDAVSLVV